MAPRIDRKLAAVMVVDVVGYSRLVGMDEAGTLARVKAHRVEFAEPLISAHRGRVFKLTGDGALVEFESAVDAVECAIAIQVGMAEREAAEAEDRRILYRIGINIGDVVHDDGDVFGDGVNIPSRLEGLADPGGVLISQLVQDSIVTKTHHTFIGNGVRNLKNITNPIRVWSWPRRLAIAQAHHKPRIYIDAIEGHNEFDIPIALDLRDEILAHLARLTGIEIAAKETDADYILQGSLSLASGRSRIFNRLISSHNAK